MLVWSVKQKMWRFRPNSSVFSVNCKKCTPKQITQYQSSLKSFKTLNDNLEDLTFEQITVFDQMRCTTRQLNFEIECNNNYKIGMNTTANKFFSLSKMISLGMIHLTFVHFKKLAKIQFLKYGSSWHPPPSPTTTRMIPL